jgi:hypothetical protein
MRPVAALAFALLLGCRGASDTTANDTPVPPKTGARPPPKAPPPTPTPGVTIEGDGKGGYRVKGGSKMKGSPAACTAYKKCCTAPGLSLFCGMLEATESTCEGALKQVKQYAKEAHVKTPAGCD